MAKILGKHPEYMFKRQFVHLTCRKMGAIWHYVADVDDYGVYECCIKRYEDKPNGTFLGQTRTWFLMFDGVRYNILRKEGVLPTWESLRQYLRKQGGGTA